MTLQRGIRFLGKTRMLNSVIASQRGLLSTTTTNNNNYFSNCQDSLVSSSHSFPGNNSNHHHHHHVRSKSTVAAPVFDHGNNIDVSDMTSILEENGPVGDLFHASFSEKEKLIGKTASIRRTFDARSNALGLLTCGGSELARHASFDPNYNRAQDWIRHHAVGPAVLSPILISGLVGALVEAALPQSVPVGCSNQQIRPLIVGVEVCAQIKVVNVRECKNNDETDNDNSSGPSFTTRQNHGYEIELETQVARLVDDALISQGTHTVWVPSFLEHL